MGNVGTEARKWFKYLVLFCSFQPVGTEANVRHGDRRAHLQNKESCYSHKEAVRTPYLGGEVSPGRSFFFFFFTSF